MDRFFAVSTAVLINCISCAVSAATWYVDGSVSQSGDGKSWETAFKYIQTAVSTASHGDTVIVALGTYRESVHLNGKNIVLRSTNALNTEVVAGTIIDGDDSHPPVRFSGDENESCVLSGFTLRDGIAWGGSGGGICGGTEEKQTHATIRDNVITRNYASTYGGGLAYCDGLIENNTITLNSAYDGGGLSDCGGVIRNNVVMGNTAEYKGGGLFKCDGVIQGNEIRFNTVDSQGGGLIQCNGTLRENVISKNSADWGAGIVYCNGIIENNLVIQNAASDSGGGVAGCDGVIRSNVIAGNTAASGAGLFGCDADIVNNTILRNSATDTPGNVYFCMGTIANCIIRGFAGDSAQQIGESSTPVSSCIQNWTGDGDGNIATDPRFVDPNGPDDIWTTYEDNDYRLLSDSPCIDAGTNGVLTPPGLDMDGNLRIARWKYPIVVYVDMGAYEYNSRPFAITQFTFVTLPWPGGRRLTWNSQPNDTYRVWSTQSLSGGWNDLGSVGSGGETTSFTATGLLPYGLRGLFYRVEME